MATTAASSLRWPSGGQRWSPVSVSEFSLGFLLCLRLSPSQPPPLDPPGPPWPLAVSLSADPQPPRLLSLSMTSLPPAVGLRPPFLRSPGEGGDRLPCGVRWRETWAYGSPETIFRQVPRSGSGSLPQLPSAGLAFPLLSPPSTCCPSGSPSLCPPPAIPLSLCLGHNPGSTCPQDRPPSLK